MVALALTLGGCSATTISATPLPTPDGTLNPGERFNGAELQLIERLPAWVTRGACSAGVGDAEDPDWIASVVCGGLGGGRLRNAPDPVWLVVIAQPRQPAGVQEFVDRTLAAWRLNDPDRVLRSSCLEGDWVGPWDDDGVVAGALACSGDGSSVEFRWNDVRSGLYGSVHFSTNDWSEAYRVWRQAQLTAMTAPARTRPPSSP